ncbi:hypothetical protein [Streptomyces syringium]|uniref:WD40 repeat protein n=1 Tax=Streptomyces syringium TaxID=76729 RepID=A0ABS4Y7B1_9ACTN|nr:hypothetical protein [Streptomyces syringium]MBP2404673.1 WD40 repeat protein [Streptomyces syringium]
MPRPLNRTRRRTVRNTLLAGLVTLCVAGGVWVCTAADDGSRFMAVCGFFVSVAALAVAVADYFRPEDEPTDPGALADDLAGTVEDQWSEEAVARSLRDPRVLPLSWSASTRPVGDAPEQVTSAAGQIIRLRLDGRLADRFDDAITQLAEGYGRAPSGRLVVLGEPGAGKTVLAILLALGLLKGRSRRGPVPVLLAASSWDPVSELLDDWIVHTLASSYYSGRHDIPRKLLDRGLLLPILDGLDEIPESARRAAIHAINRALGGDRPIVVTCRSAEYEDVIEGGAPVLRRSPVVEVEPVAVDDVIAYLGDIDWPEGTDWSPVFAHLRAPGNGNSAVTTALSTPLVVSLTRLVYRRSGGNPGDLLDSGRFDCRHAVENHLLARVIDAAYSPELLPSGRPVAGDEPRWDADKARRWLTFLATYLHQHRERDLAWWLMSQRLLSPWIAPGIGMGIGTVLMMTAVGWVSAAGRPDNDPEDALLFATVIGIGFAIVAMVIWYATAGRSPGRLSLTLRGSAQRLRRGFLLGLALVMVPAAPFLAAAYFYIPQADIDRYGRPYDWSLPEVKDYAILLATSITLAMVIGLAVAVHNWLDAPPSRSAQASPPAFVRQDRQSSLAGALGAGVVVSATFAPALAMGSFLALFGMQSIARWEHGNWFSIAATASIAAAGYQDISGFSPGSPTLLIGALYVLPGVTVALLVLLSRAWTRFLIVRAVMALRGQLPWQLLAFLSDARDRGLLRQSGGTYQFRHIRLQEQLARQGSAIASPAHLPHVGAVGTTRRRVVLGASATVVLGVVGRSATDLPDDLSRVVLNDVDPRGRDRMYAATCMAFSHDNRLVATTRNDGTLRVHEWRREELIGDFALPDFEHCWEITFSADNRGLGLNRASAGGRRRAFERRDIDSGRVLPLPHLEERCCVAASGDGRVLAAAEPAGPVRLWDRTGLRRLPDLANGGPVWGIAELHTLAFSHSGRYLAAGDRSRTVCLWDREKHTRVGTTLPTVVHVVSVSELGSVVSITPGLVAMCHLWNAKTHMHKEIPLSHHWAVSGDGTVLATAEEESDDQYVVRLWDTRTGRPRARTTGRSMHPNAVLALSHNGGVLATTSIDGKLELWAARDGRLRGHSAPGHIGAVSSAAFTRNGRFLATGGDDGTVRIWDVPRIL